MTGHRPSPDLDRFFGPRLVAVVGATDDEGRGSTVNWRLLRDWAARSGGVAVPVHPRREQVDGVPCRATLADIDEPIDVVAVLVGDSLPIVRQAVEREAAFVVVFSAGFAETGDEGRKAQEEMAAVVAGTRTRLIGPNTNLNAFERFRTDLGGRAIAIVSQSGHQGRPLFMLQDNNVRVSHWAPTGNEADVDASDFVRWFADRPEVGVVAGYLEGIADGPRFMSAARHAVEADTPITLVKVGRTEAGAATAATHTGKLAGRDRVADGMFRQLGITRVDTLDLLGDVAQVLARAGRPTSDGVAVYAISGGTCAHLSDLCGMAGLRLASFSEQTLDALRADIPDYLSVTNPVDCGGHPVGDERGARILRAIVDDPDVGVLIVPVTGPFPPLSDRLAADLAAVAETTDTLVCVVWGSPVGTEPALREVLLGSDRLFVTRSSGNAVKAVDAWLRWHRYRDRYEAPTARAAADGGPVAAVDGALDEHRSKELLARYGVPVTRERLVRTPDEAVAAAAELGFPVVLKGCSSEVAHKSELGLVRLGLADAEQVTEAFAAIRSAAADAGVPDVEVLVCEQVPGGVECVVGLVTDPVLGLAVMVGVGGVLVEAYDDVAFRVPPFTRADAREMIGELRGAALLEAHRGRPAASVDALVDVVMAVQQVALDLGDRTGQIDLNPVIVRPDGAVVVDALVVLDPTDRRTSSVPNQQGETL